MISWNSSAYKIPDLPIKDCESDFVGKLGAKPQAVKKRESKIGTEGGYFTPKDIKKETLVIKSRTEADTVNRTQNQTAKPETQIEIKRLKLDQLRTDGGTYCRTEINAFQFDDYVDAMRRGDKFPPLRA